MPIPKDEWRLIILAAIAFMLSMFILANEPEGGEAALFYIYLILFWVGTAIWAKGSQGIKKNWHEHLFLGAILGGAFIGLHAWQPTIFKIGFPQTIESVRIYIVCIIAPIAEELAFRQGIYLNILRNNNRFPFVTSVIICSAIFAAFHWFAYGATLGVSAALVGAGLFSVIACWLTERTKDPLASTIAHMMVNTMLVWGTLAVFGV